MSTIVIIPVAQAESSQTKEEAFPPPKVPPPPFSNNPSADLILRASDGVDIQVVRAILSAASPIFSDMFIVAQPMVSSASAEHSTEKPPLDGELPVVDMTEDSATLELLLRFCYPVQSPTLRTISDILSVLEAARKYAVDVAEAGCADALCKFAITQPLQVYAIACLYMLEPVARFAAPHTLAISLDELLAGAIPEAEQLSFACVQRLCAFRKACQDSITPLATIAHWVSPRSGCGQAVPVPWVRLARPEKEANPCCKETVCERRNYWGGTEAIVTKVWWCEYMKEMAAALSDVHSTGRRRAAEDEAAARAMTAAVMCPKCRPMAFKEFKAFEQAMQTALEDAITRVRDY